MKGVKIMKNEPSEQALEYLNANSEADAYELAIELLYRSEEKGYCIWQAYTKDEMTELLGKEPDENDMSAYQERLSNIWESIV